MEEKTLVPVVDASTLTADEQKEFIIKDNGDFGAWDYDALANEWNADDLKEWGVDLPVWGDKEEGREEAPHEGDKEEEENEENEIPDILDDRIFSSDNEMQIPCLLLDKQPESGVILPFNGWGTESRQKKGVGTWHFYVEDYRFTRLWNDPMQPLRTGAKSFVEPNLSLYDSTPVAFGLMRIYQKRWIARLWQEAGFEVWADLNVARKFQQWNMLGIPKGYNAFFTRGYADRLEALQEELDIAREISGKNTPNLVIYGGGKEAERWAMEHNLLYLEQFATRMKEIKKKS